MEGWNEWIIMLREALEYRKERERRWIRWLSAYRYGNPVVGADGEVIPNDSEYSVPLIRTLLSMTLPALYFRNPYVITKSRKLSDSEALTKAQAMEAVVNSYIAGNRSYKTNIRRCLLDAMIYNETYIESGWQNPFENVGTAKEGRIFFSSTPDNTPTQRRYSPWDTTYDPYSTEGVDGARWYGRRTWVPYSYVRNNAAFNPKTRAKVEIPDRNVPVRDRVREYITAVFNTRRSKKIVTDSVDQLEIDIDGLMQLWTIFDRKHDRVVVLTPTVDGLLFEDENPYKHLPGFLVTCLSFEFDVDSDPLSMVETLIPQQRELNHICSRQHDNLKRFARISEVVKDALVDQKSGLKALEEAKDGSYILVNARNQIGGIDYGDTRQPEWWNLRQATVRDAQFVGGVPATQSGVGHDKFKSATEVGLIQHSFDIRIDDLREQVSDWLEASFSKLGRNVQEFMPDEMQVYIAGEQRVVTRQELWGEEFDYQVLLSEASPENETKRLQRSQAKYQAALQDPLLDRRKAIIDYLRAMGETQPEESLAVTEEVPGNIPPNAAGGGGGAQTLPPELQAMQTGDLSGLLSMLSGGAQE